MINKPKPKAITASSVYDLQGSKFWLLCDSSLVLTPEQLNFEHFQTLSQDEDYQAIEVYDVIPSGGEKITAELGGRLFPLEAGEQRYTGNIRTTFFQPEDLSYYDNKGIYLVNTSNVIRGVKDGDNYKPIPIRQLYAVEKPILNDGVTAKFNGIGLTIDGRFAKLCDESCLGFEFSAIESPTNETFAIVDGESPTLLEFTLKDLDGNNVLNTALGTITTGLDKYIEFSGVAFDGKSVVSVNFTTGVTTFALIGLGEGTVRFKAAMLTAGAGEVTDTQVYSV